MPRKELGMAGCNSGSCDSMASTASNHSQRSDSSYDYLSVEEKECLLFLEETIGSLDTEGDSGVSPPGPERGDPSRPRDLGRRTPPPSRDQQRGGDRSSGGSVSASCIPGNPGSIPAANAASGSRGSVHAAPAGKAAQEVPREGRLGSGSHTKSVIIQPPEPFQDDLEWSRSRRSDAQGVKENKIRTSWGHPEKSTVQEAPQDPDAKRGPPTAPKPRKLPPNIILKTSRNSPVPLGSEHNQKVKAAPPPSAASHAGPASDTEKGNPGHLDPKEKEKAHREALEKLGLSQDRREPSAHLHPHPRETPLPIPGQPGEGPVLGVRQMPFKSNTLERSGVGLGSSMGSAKEQNARSSSSSLGKMSFIERLAPGFLRGGRPRPASLGAGKDFAGLKEQEEQDKSSKRRSHPLPGFPRPPRSAVSVKISPKGAADENRREALKKLGLLKE
ncbi:specifically androgen-regulated gene protein [Prinia subflava]|uniref:specifically androgen-regulated gene protein n=1 Tax=Prinia subflava TaxID=208062 RepID=UPI002FE2FC7F